MSTTAAASDYLERAIMRWLGRNTDLPSPPATVYLALFTGGVPDDAGGTATEVAVGNYARLALTTGTSGTGVGSTFADPSSTNGQLANSANVDFPAASGSNWGTITGWALFDAASAGNMLVRGDVVSTDINIGDIFRFTAAGWTITLS